MAEHSAVNRRVVGSSPTPGVRANARDHRAFARHGYQSGYQVMSLSSRDISTALQPELDELVTALTADPVDTEAERAALAALLAGIERMQVEHDLDWPRTASLVVVEQACIAQGTSDQAKAVRAVKDLLVWGRGEQAKMN
jgi:hypothetical protein